MILIVTGDRRIEVVLSIHQFSLQRVFLVMTSGRPYVRDAGTWYRMSHIFPRVKNVKYLQRTDE
jgi:hypothetical protein